MAADNPISDQYQNRYKVMHILETAGTDALLTVYTMYKRYPDDKNIKDHLIFDFHWSEYKYKSSFDRAQREVIMTTPSSGKSYDTTLLNKCIRVLYHIYSVGNPLAVKERELVEKCQNLINFQNRTVHLVSGLNCVEMVNSIDEIQVLIRDILYKLKLRFPHKAIEISYTNRDIDDQMQAILEQPVTESEIKYGFQKIFLDVIMVVAIVLYIYTGALFTGEVLSLQNCILLGCLISFLMARQQGVARLAILGSAILALYLYLLNYPKVSGNIAGNQVECEIFPANEKYNKQGPPQMFLYTRPIQPIMGIMPLVSKSLEQIPRHHALTFVWDEDDEHTFEAFEDETNGRLRSECYIGNPQNIKSKFEWEKYGPYSPVNGKKYCSPNDVRKKSIDLTTGDYEILANNCQKFVESLAKHFGVILDLSLSKVLFTSKKIITKPGLVFLEYIHPKKKRM